MGHASVVKEDLAFAKNMCIMTLVIGCFLFYERKSDKPCSAKCVVRGIMITELEVRLRVCPNPIFFIQIIFVLLNLLNM